MNANRPHAGAETLRQTALGHLAMRRFREAADGLHAALAQQPEDSLLHAALGRALQQLGLEFDAVEEFRQALALGADPALNLMLAELLFDQGDADGAAAQLDAFAARASDRLAGQLALAGQLMAEDADSRARTCAERLLRDFPDAAPVHGLLGMLAVRRGNFPAADEYFRRALSLDPDDAQALQGLVSIRRATVPDDPLIGELGRLSAKPSLPLERKALAHYGLGKVREDLQDYDAAWQHFSQANRLMRAALLRTRKPLDLAAHAATVDRLVSLFAPGSFTQSQTTDATSDRPIFIVGMIRSGTTLVEQILSRHPHVAAGGELRFWKRRAHLHELLQAGDFTPEAADQTRSAYEKLLASISMYSRIVTDKMPTNFLLLGLIHRLFPCARIVHCTRDPRDVAISIFTTVFGNPPDFAHDWDSILSYQRQYARLMRHWEKVLPGANLFELSYEELVARPEKTIRALIGFCGLEWSDACLSPQAGNRVVATPSNWQVRQPVHDRSVGRWRHYTRWRGELEEVSR